MEPVKKDLKLRGQRIYLRPITEEDTARVVRWRNEKSVVENFIYRKPISEAEHREWLKSKVETGLVHQLIVCRNEDDAPLGCVYLQNFEETNRKAEEGIFLGERGLCGSGIGTEAAKLMLSYAFDTLGLHKLVARVLAFNRSSIRMHEKAGYTQEAYLKEELFLNGKYEDLILFGAINPER